MKKEFSRLEMLESALLESESLVKHPKTIKEMRTWKSPTNTITLSQEEIRQLRAKTHASQAVFAKALGVSSYTVQSWEHGYSKPSGAAARLLQLFRDLPAVRNRLLGV